MVADTRTVSTQIEEQQMPDGVKLRIAGNPGIRSFAIYAACLGFFGVVASVNGLVTDDATVTAIGAFVLVVVAVMVFLLLRSRQTAVVVTRQGLEVVNPGKRQRVPWGDITGMEIVEHNTAPEVTLVLAGGGRVRIMATRVNGSARDLPARTRLLEKFESRLRSLQAELA